MPQTATDYDVSMNVDSPRSGYLPLSASRTQPRLPLSSLRSSAGDTPYSSGRQPRDFHANVQVTYRTADGTVASVPYEERIVHNLFGRTIEETFATTSLGRHFRRTPSPTPPPSLTPDDSLSPSPSSSRSMYTIYTDNSASEIDRGIPPMSAKSSHLNAFEQEYGLSDDDEKWYEDEDDSSSSDMDVDGAPPRPPKMTSLQTTEYQKAWFRERRQWAQTVRASRCEPDLPLPRPQSALEQERRASYSQTRSTSYQTSLPKLPEIQTMSRSQSDISTHLFNDDNTLPPIRHLQPLLPKGPSHSHLLRPTSIDSGSRMPPLKSAVAHTPSRSAEQVSTSFSKPFARPNNFTQILNQSPIESSGRPFPGHGEQAPAPARSVSRSHKHDVSKHIPRDKHHDIDTPLPHVRRPSYSGNKPAPLLSSSSPTSLHSQPAREHDTRNFPTTFGPNSLSSGAIDTNFDPPIHRRSISTVSYHGNGDERVLHGLAEDTSIPLPQPGPSARPRATSAPKLHKPSSSLRPQGSHTEGQVSGPPFVCECGTSFTRHFDLERHNKQKHSKAPQTQADVEVRTCTNCSRVLSRVDATKRHVDTMPDSCNYAKKKEGLAILPTQTAAYYEERKEAYYRLAETHKKPKGRKKASFV